MSSGESLPDAIPEESKKIEKEVLGFLEKMLLKKLFKF
jgi:hypothetical protein